ncbi:DUF86 domain-containing protein [Brevibacillus migulae]|uniref:DUF86 domain-containing protein n=1 Tax=Brevibacillus migulae TaxID=1644114 RepID=UPI00106DF241|nr:HepT-like ribonuclease domain-containing protein [Brevibacillus migulae]
MYDINTARIEDRLTHMDRMLTALSQLTLQNGQGITEKPIELLAMERALHTCIEAIVDVGNDMIDGFIMRDPGSYADVVEILRDEKVLTDVQAKQLTEVVEFRRQLVNEYTKVPAADMAKLVEKSVEVLGQFAPAVRSYIQKEAF